MNNKYKKGAFIIIISLFIIMLPLTIVGIIFNYKNSNIDNPKKELYYNNHLYFYNNNEELISKYECMYKKCGYAVQMNYDDDYGIKYYKSEEKILDKIVNNRYVFIADYKDEQNMVYLYDIVKKDISATYRSVKNYGIGISNNYYIVEALTGTYGVIKIENDKVTNILPFVYEYIALQDDVDLEQNKLLTDAFIVKKENRWYLVDENGAEFTQGSEQPIVSFDASTYIVKNDNYNIYNYDGNLKLFGSYKYLNYIYNYIEVKDVNNNYYILDKKTMTLVSKLYQVTNDSITVTKINQDNKLEIIIDDESKEVIEIL